MRVLVYLVQKTKIENSSIIFFLEITSTETIGGQKAAVTDGGLLVRQGRPEARPIIIFIVSKTCIIERHAH